ncbi:MAG: hypothetical protein GY727_10665, partial [Gammaproteobacteria bacterium]|nr:hypothetical protein [Gammaproteobacteria bacterium]
LDVATETGTLIVESGESTHVDVDADTGEVHVTADEGTVDFETRTGTAVIEEGEVVGTNVDKGTGEVRVSSEVGMIGFETSMGNVMMREGNVIGALLDATTGEIIMTAEVGMMEFETAMGKAMMEEGEVVGALLDAETGNVIMTAQVGMVEFETAMGRVMMDEGDAMGAHIDAESGQMFMTAEQGDIMFETSAGTANLEHGEIVGTAFDQDTGQVTMTAMVGEVSFDTPMGLAVMQEGAVVEVVFNDNTGEMSMSSGGGSYTLETDNGIITMEDGGSMEFTVDHNTGEITVTGVTGDVVMTNEDGTTMTIEPGTSLGTMHDDGHDGPMGPNDGNDGPMGPNGHDGEGPEDGTFEGNITEADGGMVYEGTMTDAFGMWSGIYNEGTDQFIGILQLNDGNSFTFNADGSVMDQYGNMLTQQQIQQLMSQNGGNNDPNDPNDPNNPNNNGPSPPSSLDFNQSLIFDDQVNIVDMSSQKGVDIDYSGADNTDATYKGTGPTNLTYVDGASIDGKSGGGGQLTLTFNTATPLVSFGSALSANTNLAAGFTVRLFDESNNLISTANRQLDGSNNLIGTSSTVKDVDTVAIGSWSEGLFNHVGSLVKKVTIDYNYAGGADPRFLFDNLFYTKDARFFDDFQTSNTNNGIGSWWNHHNLSASTSTSFGSNVIAKSGNTGDRFAAIHTGGGVHTGRLGIDFNFAEGADRHFSFDYNVITTELNTGTDTFTAKLILPDLSFVPLNLDFSNMIAVSGLIAEGLDIDSGSQTGWRTFADTLYIPAGITQLVFEVIDAGGDNDNDSALLLDNVLDPIVETSSTDYMLTFARMLRGDVDIHDADLEADTVISEEHQAFIARVNEAINDIENSSGSEFVAGQDAFFDRLLVARDTLENHEDTHEFLQKAGVAHRLLEASIMATEDVGANITAIKDSINQARTFLVAHVNDFGETDAIANIKTNIDSVLANIENVNNNEFSTDTIAAIRDGIQKAFSDTIDHMSADGHECLSGNHLECNQSS